ncbi:hypothetical protein FC19_GL001460 [Liquorilactobacillus aquaticus DSM 21051]|uniref:YopX protein domain-containing protein n=2 Tax=Liquorilactobacillus aquaticus TaxID=392566 RepID=A0A0R2D663_9LACO|nr:hypothetical protein FC19_GL001460 [Liquorilactobacillus aquaticus DSM 21051]
MRYPDELGGIYLGTASSNLVLEQYTGLKDKSGKKKIFEGSIVKTEDLYGHPVNYEVKYHNGEWEAGIYVLNHINRYCEVIGDIHNNPELLEVGE